MKIFNFDIIITGMQYNNQKMNNSKCLSTLERNIIANLNIQDLNDKRDIGDKAAENGDFLTEAICHREIQEKIVKMYKNGQINVNTTKDPESKLAYEINCGPAHFGATSVLALSEGKTYDDTFVWSTNGGPYQTGAFVPRENGNKYIDPNHNYENFYKQQTPNNFGFVQQSTASQLSANSLILSHAMTNNMSLNEMLYLLQ
jgi:hypothetical protein